VCSAIHPFALTNQLTLWERFNHPESEETTINGRGFLVNNSRDIISTTSTIITVWQLVLLPSPAAIAAS
jgi:hypothetical protein